MCKLTRCVIKLRRVFVDDAGALCLHAPVAGRGGEPPRRDRWLIGALAAKIKSLRAMHAAG